MLTETDKKKAMLSAKRIIVISPHPDDAEIIAGGYLAMASSSGAQVKLVVVTDGGKGTKVAGEDVKDVRKKEQEEAAKCLGIKDLSFLGIQDTEVPSPSILTNVLLPIMREYAPDVAITVDPFLKYESHMDHINTGHAVLQSVLFHPLPNISSGTIKSPPPLLALSPSNRPNVIIGIDNFMKEKIDSISCHKSQRINIDDIIQSSSVYGAKVGCRYGEAFVVLTYKEIHMNPFAFEEF